MKSLEDIMAENQKLTTDLAAANQTIGGLQGQVTSLTAEKATVTTERDTARADLTTAQANLATVTGERDTLKTENANLQGQMKDFNARVAAEVARVGVQQPAASAPKNPETKQETWTERAKAAKSATK